MGQQAQHDQFEAAQEGLRHQAGQLANFGNDLGTHAGNSAAAADVAALMRDTARLERLGAGTAGGVKDAWQREQYQGAVQQSSSIRTGLNGLGVRGRSIRATHKIELSAGAAFAAGAAMATVSEAIDAHRVAQYQVVAFASGRSAALQSRAAALQLSMGVPAVPAHAFTALQLQSARAAQLGANVFRAAANLLGFDIASAADLQRLTAYAPRLQGAYFALVGLSLNAATARRLRQVLEGISEFSHQQDLALKEKYSGLLGFMRRHGDEFINNFGRGWQRTTLASLGGLFDGLAEATVGLVALVPKLAVGAYHMVGRGLDGDNPFGDAGMHTLTDMAKGLWHQVEDLNPVNALNNKYGDTYEERLGHYFHNIGAILPDIAIAAATGGTAAAAERAGLLAETIASGDAIATVASKLDELAAWARRATLPGDAEFALFDGVEAAAPWAKGTLLEGLDGAALNAALGKFTRSLEGAEFVDAVTGEMRILSVDDVFELSRGDLVPHSNGSMTLHLDPAREFGRGSYSWPIRDADGVIDGLNIHVHGNPNNFSFPVDGGVVRFGPDVMAGYLEKLGVQVPAVSHINLLSCSTAGSAAQDLANALGVPVRAPVTDIFAASDGYVFERVSGSVPVRTNIPGFQGQLMPEGAVQDTGELMLHEHYYESAGGTVYPASASPGPNVTEVNIWKPATKVESISGMPNVYVEFQPGGLHPIVRPLTPAVTGTITGAAAGTATAIGGQIGAGR